MTKVGVNLMALNAIRQAMCFLIETDDQEQLECSLFTGNSEKGVVIISSAMGVPRQFYHTLASYLLEKGFTVITFDYRGIGGSAKVKNHATCRLNRWGSHDLNAVINYAEQKFSDQPLFLVGHSIAGQIFPFAGDCNKITKAYLIASQNVSKTNWSGKDKVSVTIFWHLVVPLVTTLFNRLPGFAYGGKVAIPKLIARDWAAWGKSSTGAPGVVSNGNNAYQQLKVPTRFISFSDDQLLAPKKAVEMLYQSYGGSKKEHIHIQPKEMGYNEIGHFRYFKKKMKVLWEDIDQWFTEM